MKFLFLVHLILFVSSQIVAQNQFPGQADGIGGWLSGMKMQEENSLVMRFNGSGILGNTYNLSKIGLNYVQSSVNLNQRCSDPGLPPGYLVNAGQIQPVPLTISGIPPGAVIEQAFLWWTVQGNVLPVYSGLILNPANVFHIFNGTMIGSNPGTCWPGGSIWAFREDVTSLIDPNNPNGIYQLFGLPVSFLNNGGLDTDGATLMIIYSHPAGVYTGHLTIDDGMVYWPSMNSDIINLIPPAPENSSFAKGFALITEAQTFYGPSQYDINSEAPVIFAENFWNFEEQITTISLGQVGSTTNLTAIGHPNTFGWQSDCLGLVASGMYFQTSHPLADIPTMGEWALVLLGLIVLILGTVTIFSFKRQQKLQKLV